MAVVVIDGAVVHRVVAIGVPGPQGAQGVQGPQGAPAEPPFRGLAYRIASGTIDFAGVDVGDFISSGLTGTLDSAVSVDVAAAGVNKFGLKRTASGSAWCHVIATADVAGSSNKRIAIQLALNGTVIPATECNITITNQTIGKLHTMYLFNLDEDDEVTVWFANKSNQQAITVERARMTLAGVA